MPEYAAWIVPFVPSYPRRPKRHKNTLFHKLWSWVLEKTLLSFGINRGISWDKKKQNEEIMGLYRTYKINPMGGCLPMFLQIPVFFALYKVLYISIEMRHAPFFGWITDLSAPDPTSLFNLFGLIPISLPAFLMIGIWPILMGISMWVQMKLNPAPTDPMQQKIFTWMPVFFTFLLVTTLLTVSVNQRLGEVAALRALGFARRRVVSDLIWESMLLVGAGWVLSRSSGGSAHVLGLGQGRYSPFEYLIQMTEGIGDPIGPRPLGFVVWAALAVALTRGQLSRPLQRIGRSWLVLAPGRGSCPPGRSAPSGAAGE